MAGCRKRLGTGFGTTAIRTMDAQCGLTFCNMNIDPTTTDLEVIFSYVEDNTELNVLVSTKVSPDDKPGNPEPRWIVIADPDTREIIRVEFAIVTDEGFEYPEYTPTDEQMALFKNFTKDCE